MPAVRGYIDAPDGRSPLPRGPLAVRGWAFGNPSPVARVEVHLDGRYLGCAGLGRLRADVSEALQDEDAELSGFELRCDALRPGPRNGPVPLGARITLVDGTSAELPPVEVTFDPDPAPANAPLTGNGGPPAPRRRFLAGLVAPLLGPRRAPRLLCHARSLDRGGSQLRLRELVAHLQATGAFRCTVVAPEDGPLRADLESSGADVAVHTVPIHDAAGYDRGLDAMAAWAAGRFDVTLAATLTSFPAVDLAERLAIPAVWRIGELEPLPVVVEWLRGRVDPAVELRARRAFRTASLVLFNSNAALQRHRYRGGEGRCEVVPTWADAAGAQAYVERTDRGDCRRMLGIPPHRRLLLCSGTLWPIKGQALLASALLRLRDEHPGLACVLVGQQFDPYAQAVARFVHRHRLEDTVRLVPFCDDLRPWLRAADVAVCPSESESMPASILEAMAFGLPVLAARVGGVPEVVEDGATGWLCAGSDLRSLMDGLARVATASPDEIRALGDRAMRRVAGAHDRGNVLGRLAEILLQAAHGARVPMGTGRVPHPRPSGPAPPTGA